MAAYAAGDQGAFKELFSRIAPRVHAFFLRAFRKKALADDLLQTTFLNVHRARAGYARGAPVRPWIFTIANNVRLDELRRRYRLRAEASEEEIDRVADPSISANDALSDGETARAVRAAIDRLPESQRVVVLLHRYEELTFAQIAQALGTTEGAIKLRAFRAYEQLRAALAPVVEGSA